MQREVAERKRREIDLLMRLTAKHKEFLQMEDELKLTVTRMSERGAVWRSAYMDPLINDNFRSLHAENELLQKKLKESQDDLNAAMFTTEGYSK